MAKKKKIARKMIKLAGSVPLFQALTKRQLRQLLRVGKEVEFPAGATIVEEGLDAMDFYLLLLGDAEVFVHGRRRRAIGPGDYFGEISVIDGGPRSATVMAKTRVLALRLDRPQFMRLLDREGSIGRKILLVMSQRLRAAESAPARSPGFF
jgi:CRP/FNR family transcriptional regulator, cyclic AMP receptor protein